MSEIRIQKIDGVEFVTLTDYLRLKEENKNLNKQIEQFKKGVKAGTNIIERLEEENKKLKDRIAELEKCNLNLQEYIDKQNRGYEPQFENGFPKYKLLNYKQ